MVTKQLRRNYKETEPNERNLTGMLANTRMILL